MNNPMITSPIAPSDPAAIAKSLIANPSVEFAVGCEMGCNHDSQDRGTRSKGIGSGFSTLASLDGTLMRSDIKLLL
jgi:hypothetical protein